MTDGALARDDEIDQMLRALAEHRRRAILHLVSDRERTAGEIAAEFEVTRTAVSQHLTVLKEAGLLTERREGTRRYYCARREVITKLHDAIDQIWSSALDRGRALAEEAR